MIEVMPVVQECVCVQHGKRGNHEALGRNRAWLRPMITPPLRGNNEALGSSPCGTNLWNRNGAAAVRIRNGAAGERLAVAARPGIVITQGRFRICQTV